MDVLVGGHEGIFLRDSSSRQPKIFTFFAPKSLQFDAPSYSCSQVRSPASKKIPIFLCGFFAGV
jgi:hypothetical protein